MTQRNGALQSIISSTASFDIDQNQAVGVEFDGAGALTVDSLGVPRLGAASLTGVGNVSASATQGLWATISFAGVAVLSADLTQIGGGTSHQGEATFAGLGSISVLPALVLPGAVTLLGAGDLSADALRSTPAAITMAGIGDFTILPQLVQPAEASFAGASISDIMAQLSQAANVDWLGGGQLSGLSGLAQVAVARFDGVGASSIEGTRIKESELRGRIVHAASESRVVHPRRRSPAV